MTSHPYPSTIDVGAPVVARRSLWIAAPRARVWDAHVDVGRWPQWQSDIGTASIDGPLAVGSTITWMTAGIDGLIPSTIYALSPQSRTLWGGSAGGVMGIHEWQFSDAKDGTLVETNESWAGQPVAADVETMQAALEKSLDDWLHDLDRHLTG